TDRNRTAGTSCQERSARCSAAPARPAQVKAAIPNSGAPMRTATRNWAMSHVAILSVRRRSGLRSTPSQRPSRRARLLMPLMPFIPFLRFTRAPLAALRHGIARVMGTAADIDDTAACPRSAQLSEERVTWLCGADPDPRVHGPGAVRGGD